MTNQGGMALSSGEPPATESISTQSWCPSSHDAEETALVFAVVEGTPAEPRATYLRRSLPLVAVRHLAAGVAVEEVFRVAAPCAGSGCVHFDDNQCSLAQRVVDELEPVQDALPRCAIRSRCRWWSEQGIAACRRCPQVVTLDYAPDANRLAAAMPTQVTRPEKNLGPQ
jgi:hypothetical protein